MMSSLLNVNNEIACPLSWDILLAVRHVGLEVKRKSEVKMETWIKHSVIEVKM